MKYSNFAVPEIVTLLFYHHAAKSWLLEALFSARFPGSELPSAYFVIMCLCCNVLSEQLYQRVGKPIHIGMEHILGKLLLPTLGVINLKSLVLVFVAKDPFFMNKLQNWINLIYWMNWRNEMNWKIGRMDELDELNKLDKLSELGKLNEWIIWMNWMI